MKRILFALAVVCTIQQMFSQELPISEKTNKISYEGVINIEEASATDLYVKANEWFAITFNSREKTTPCPLFAN